MSEVTRFHLLFKVYGHIEYYKYELCIYPLRAKFCMDFLDFPFDTIHQAYHTHREPYNGQHKEVYIALRDLEWNYHRS